MPELPDVEVRKRYLERTTKGRMIRKALVNDPYIARGQEIENIEQKLTGAEIQSLMRRGKFIIINTGNGILLLHLGMTGDVFVLKKDEEQPRFTRAVFNLDGCNFYFSDQRKFGKVAFYRFEKSDYIPEIAKLGPEPLGPEFKFEYFKKIIRSHSTVIHKVLMIQKEIAGIGNVYADEICFRAGIKPDRKTGQLTEAEIQKLYKAIKNVLSEAIELEADLSKKPERFIIPHRRGDKKCPSGDSALEHKKIGGRTSYWCPAEQS